MEYSAKKAKSGSQANNSHLENLQSLKYLRLIMLGLDLAQAPGGINDDTPTNPTEASLTCMHLRIYPQWHEVGTGVHIRTWRGQPSRNQLGIQQLSSLIFTSYKSICRNRCTYGEQQIMKQPNINQGREGDVGISHDERGTNGGKGNTLRF